MKHLLALGFALSLAGVGAACSDPVAPAPPTPVSPTITETFTGTLTIGGSNLHQFQVNQIGGLKVTLNDVTPSAAVLLSVGTPSAATGACAALSGLTTVASPSAQISGTATVTGNFCVSVADVGNLVESVSYTISVTHS
ncbi:MAG TPA: hypothetical protein VFB07_09325 [Vicinamibacterales bacterium]|nr:hypothetical protein [Vicinamibacterales bacterium]